LLRDGEPYCGVARGLSFSFLSFVAASRKWERAVFVALLLCVAKVRLCWASQKDPGATGLVAFSRNFRALRPRRGPTDVPAMGTGENGVPGRNQPAVAAAKWPRPCGGNVARGTRARGRILVKNSRCKSVRWGQDASISEALGLRQAPARGRPKVYGRDRPSHGGEGRGGLGDAFRRGSAWTTAFPPSGPVADRKKRGVLSGPIHERISGQAHGLTRASAFVPKPARAAPGGADARDLPTPRGFSHARSRQWWLLKPLKARTGADYDICFFVAEGIDMKAASGSTIPDQSELVPGWGRGMPPEAGEGDATPLPTVARDFDIAAWRPGSGAEFHRPSANTVSTASARPAPSLGPTGLSTLPAKTRAKNDREGSIRRGHRQNLRRDHYSPTGSKRPAKCVWKQTRERLTITGHVVFAGDPAHHQVARGRPQSGPMSPKKPQSNP